MAKTVMIGQKIRDFELKDQNGLNFRPADCRGKRLLLSFHPLAWTSVCARQMLSLEKNGKAFQRENTVAVGLSVDSVPCKAAWARSLKIRETRLLADFWPHGGAARSLGLLREGGVSERANVILDETGRAIFVKIYPLSELPDIAEILAFLKGAAAGRPPDKGRGTKGE